MKILKNNVFIDITCPHCTSELRVYEKDIDVNHHFGHGIYIHIYCAACGEKIPLTIAQLRPEWKHLLIDPNDDD